MLQKNKTEEKQYKRKLRDSGLALNFSKNSLELPNLFFLLL